MQKNINDYCEPKTWGDQGGKRKETNGPRSSRLKEGKASANPPRVSRARKQLAPRINKEDSVNSTDQIEKKFIEEGGKGKV